MASRKNQSILAVLLIFVLLVNLFNVQVAFADGEPPTEPPVAAEVGTEPAGESTPEPVESTPIPEEVSPVAPASETPEVLTSEETPAEENTTVTAILSDVPENTNVVVLDKEGQALALGSQATADAVVNADPVWCPAGISPPTPGVGGCSASYASITDLLTAMRTTPGSFNQDGTIFLEVLASPGFTTPLILDDSAGSLSTAFDTLKARNLIVRGGWNPGTGTVSGAQALFGVSGVDQGYILIGSMVNPWVGNITLRDIEVRDTSITNAITVYTSTGNINFDDVDVAQQTGDNYTAYLHSISGNIDVGNGGNYDGNDIGIGINESRGFYAETGTGSITITGNGTSYTFKDNEGTDPVSHNGATLKAPTVTLTNVRSQANDGNGIEIFNANTVTLNNVVSSLDNPATTGNGLSGVLIHGTGSTIVNLHGGTFTNNGRYGIELFNGYLYVHTPPTCPGTATANGLGCYNVTPASSDTTSPVITPNVTGTLGSNGWYTSNVSLVWTVTDPESAVTKTGCVDQTITADQAAVTYSCSASSAGGSSGPVDVTIKRDATAPTGISGAPNRVPDSGSAYTHAVDIVFNGSDATSGIASCSTTTYSGPNGNAITVNGSCMDNAGNTANGVSSAFNYDDTPPTLPTPAPTSISPASGSSTSGSSSSQSGSSSAALPAIGGALIDLDCNSEFLVFGVRVSFMNLCDQQTVIKAVEATTLPGDLPAGSSFVMGLNLAVLSDGQPLETLPPGTGVELDFPVGATGEYAVLFWDEAQGEWVEVSSALEAGEIAGALSSENGDGLYQLSEDIADLFFEILTTNQTGIFVLVQK